MDYTTSRYENVNEIQFVMLLLAIKCLHGLKKSVIDTLAGGRLIFFFVCKKLAISCIPFKVFISPF